MLWTIAIVILVLIVSFLAAAAGKPNSFRVSREATIEAPPEKIFPLIADFHQWEEWSPWDKLDPQLKRTYSGALSGVGAVYEWNGNGKAGQGRMEAIGESAPNLLDLTLVFVRPFPARNKVRFTLTPIGKGTLVHWDMSGPNPFAAKVFQMFINMDKLVGGDFEKGLAAMKAIAEKR